MCAKEENSSSKDQLTGMNVAIKKIMKPFSAPVLAKRTYRELKLLKALRHENVSQWMFLTYFVGDLVLKHTHTNTHTHTT